jgi:hypothetical protein
VQIVSVVDRAGNLCCKADGCALDEASGKTDRPGFIVTCGGGSCRTGRMLRVRASAQEG